MILQHRGKKTLVSVFLNWIVAVTFGNCRIAAALAERRYLNKPWNTRNGMPYSNSKIMTMIPDIFTLFC